MLDYHKVGKDYWWVKAKHDILLTFLQDKLKTDSLVLDAGCGVGYFIERLCSKVKIVGLDSDKELLIKVADKRVILSDLANLPFKSDIFDAVVILDVLEHLKEDTIVIRELYRILKDKSYIFIVAPVFPILYGKHDQLHAHFRRYRKRELFSKLNSFGFSKVEVTIFGWSIFLPIYCFRRLQKIFLPKIEKDDCFGLPYFLNKLMTILIKIDYRISRLFRISIGVSSITWAIAKK